MPIESTRITIDALSCGDCDCGACLTSAFAALNTFDGVVYVGFDRRHLRFKVRYHESVTEEAALHEVVQSCGLIVIPTPTRFLSPPGLGGGDVEVRDREGTGPVIGDR
jgi:hypothetical protein